MYSTCTTILFCYLFANYYIQRLFHIDHKHSSEPLSQDVQVNDDNTCNLIFKSNVMNLLLYISN